MSLNTDLPDNTDLMVSVSRTYFEKGSTTEYSINYLDEESNIRTWRTQQSIYLDNWKWKSDLNALQAKLELIGLGFEIGAICQNITIRFTVPANQHDLKFGELNSNLKGKAVTIEENLNLNLVKKNIEIEYPL